MAKLIPTDIVFFPTPSDFRTWMQQNHASRDQLWVGFYRKKTGKPSIDWPQSVDQALCFGWIDGIRKKIDDESYTIRFTPRRKHSHWSAVNIKRIRELIAEGLVMPAGMAAWEKRDPRISAQATYEREEVAFSAAQEATFKANAKAWAFFEALPPGIRRLSTGWVTAAKRPETQARRLATLIADSEAGLRIKQLRRPPKN